MRSSVVAAVVLAVFLAPQFASAQQIDAPAPPPSQPAAAPVSQPPPVPRTQTQLDEESASIFMAQKQYQEADKIYLRLAKEYPRNPAYPNYSGIAHIQMRDLDGARRMFERAVKADKTFSEGYHNLGAIWFSMKDYKKAIRQYEKALQLRPDTAAYYVSIGYAYFSRNKIPEAIQSFQKALMLDPAVFDRTGRGGTVVADRSIADHALFNFMMAKSYAQMGDGVRCALYLRKAKDEGYKQMDKVSTDPAFAKMLAHPDVQAVLGLAAPVPQPGGN